jgi:glutaryl-CoA dehydrogenase
LITLGSDPTVAGLAEMRSTRMARHFVDARDMLGDNGTLLDRRMIRHMADIEAIHTFEGTETIQKLIVGRDITGIGACS